MKIEEIRVYRYRIPLLMPFRISAGEIREKEGVLVEMYADGICGWGEASVDAVPFYAHETTGSVIDLYERALLDLIVGHSFDEPEEVVAVLEKYRGGAFAKAAIEAAFWDIYGKKAGVPVWKLLGGVRKQVEGGPSIGIKKSPAETVKAVAGKIAEGYRRIKVKVMPGFDLDYIAAIRSEFPDITLMVDANNAYSHDDFEHLAKFDRFDLQMIEQPLCEEDIYFHSLLRRKIKTPVCLDESIHTYNDALSMIALGAADILNVKICRVGGLCNARKIIKLCEDNGIGNWIGSRVGSGVAEAPRLAAAALGNCIYATDAVISGMYMPETLLAADFTVNGCMISEPEAPGLGIEVDRDKLQAYSEVVLRK